MNEMDLKFSKKKKIFFNKYKNAFPWPWWLPSTYLILAHKMIIESVLKLYKCNFSPLQNTLNFEAECPLKKDISVEKLKERLIEWHCLISKFCSHN